VRKWVFDLLDVAIADPTKTPSEVEAMTRTDVNPWEWSKGFGFSQAVDLRGAEQVLPCSGQTAVGDDGSPPSTSDMGEQVRKAFENLSTVLGATGLTMADIVRIHYYTTDVDELIGVLLPLRSEFLGDNLLASTLVGVTRLAFPELKIEIEAMAAR
jgi:enamine deaminase RidA (YjgF/YER057c/UK114 family)